MTPAERVKKHEGHENALDLHLKPIALRDANAFVSERHRHLKPARGCKFVLSVADSDERVRGVAIVGRPSARMLDDGYTAEVTRCCTDGAANACSMLYGAARRAARAMGFTRVVTYTLPEEGGQSLRGAGWRLLGRTGGGEWTRPGRLRQAAQRPEQKLLWESP